MVLLHKCNDEERDFINFIQLSFHYVEKLLYNLLMLQTLLEICPISQFQGGKYLFVCFFLVHSSTITLSLSFN